MVQAEGDGHTGPMRDSPSLDPLLAWSSHLTAPREQVGTGTWGTRQAKYAFVQSSAAGPRGDPWCPGQAVAWVSCADVTPEVNRRARAGVPAGLREGLGPGERPQAADPAKLRQPRGGQGRAGWEPSSKGTERRGVLGRPWRHLPPPASRRRGWGVPQSSSRPSWPQPLGMLPGGVLGQWALLRRGRLQASPADTLQRWGRGQLWRQGEVGVPDPGVNPRAPFRSFSGRVLMARVPSGSRAADTPLCR